MEGKVVFEGQTNKGLKFTLRYPKKNDLKLLLDFINEASAERTYIRHQGDQITQEEERKFLDKILADIESKRAVHLLVLVGDKLAGNCGVVLHNQITAHVGSIGIIISKKFRGLGLGKILMEKVMEEAEKKLSGLKIFRLGCFALNKVALNLYKELGFKEYGRLPEGFSYREGYDDEVLMYKKIR